MIFDAYSSKLDRTPIVDNSAEEFEAVKRLFQRYCLSLSVSPKDFLRKRDSGIVVKAQNGFSYSLARQCFVHYCKYNFKTVGVIKLGKLLGVDHTTICVARKKSEDFFDVKDEKFISYYNVLLDVVENLVRNPV